MKLVLVLPPSQAHRAGLTAMLTRTCPSALDSQDLKEAKDPQRKAVLDGRQLALKVRADQPDIPSSVTSGRWCEESSCIASLRYSHSDQSMPSP